MREEETMVEEAIRKLREQQGRVKERSAPWLAAEQLMDICRREPESAELIAQDLDNPEMGIVQAERQIKVYADAHKTGNFSCVTPMESEDILRKFYGLPVPRRDKPFEGGAVSVDLADFLL